MSLLGRVGLRRRMGGMAIGLSQNGLHASGEFARAERLHQIIAAANLQADDPVDFTGAGGEENDRNARPRADGLAEFEAAAVGQADIENDEREFLGGQGGQTCLSGGTPVGLEAFGFQRIQQRVGDGRFIFDDQNFRRHVGRAGGCGQV